MESYAAVYQQYKNVNKTSHVPPNAYFIQMPSVSDGSVPENSNSDSLTQKKQRPQFLDATSCTVLPKFAKTLHEVECPGGTVLGGLATGLKLRTLHYDLVSKTFCTLSGEFR